MATTAYCTVDDLRNRLSAVGVSLRADDTPPTTLGDVISRASSKINQYCLPRYTAINLAASDWTNEVATTLAVFYLCTRRANPPPQSAAFDYKEAIEDLKLVRRGQLNVPDVAMRRAAAPVLSNVHIQLHPVPHTRVEKVRSTGTVTDYPQKVDPFETIDYVI